MFAERLFGGVAGVTASAASDVLTTATLGDGSSRSRFEVKWFSFIGVFLSFRSRFPSPFCAARNFDNPEAALNALHDMLTKFIPVFRSAAVRKLPSILRQAHDH
jgi:hypothetical protein